MSEFNPIEYWEQQRNNAETALIIAQKELHRLLGADALENVIEVDFSGPDEAS